MNVLIAVADIYSKAGGGESFFKRLIRSNPADDYTVLDSGSGLAQAPTNVQAVRVGDYHKRQFSEHGFAPPSDLPAGLDLSTEGERLAQLMDIAAAVAGRSFDVIEIPDYQVHAWLLIPILKRFGVRWGKVVLSMHGTISDALRDNWPGDGVGDLSLLEATESLLFRTCDVRYGIGRPYVDAWSRTEGLPAHLLDPLHILDMKAMSLGRLYWPEALHRAPDLAFIGRQDRWKGPDLFIEIASRVPRAAYDYLHLYGPSTVVCGRDSLVELARLADHRGLKYHTNRPVQQAVLMESLAKEPLVAVLPSRRDTFNLVALEALLNGCPTALSTRCGAVDFLRRAMPDIPRVEIELERLDDAARRIEAVLRSYNDHRAALRDRLERLAPVGTGRSLPEIHAEAPSADPDARALGERVADRVFQTMDRMTAAQLTNARADLRDDSAAVKVQTGFAMGDEAFDTALTVSAETRRVREEIGFDASPPPHEGELLTRSGDTLARLLPRIGAGDRVPIYEVLTTLERARGNPAVFAAYAARLMRLTGRAPSTQVDALCEALTELGLLEEARVARMCFTPGQPGLYDYLQGRLAAPPGPPEDGIVERVDRRREAIPRVTVVVSLYNGATKLPRFLRMLASQEPAARAVMEVVLVDSNSTDDTREVALHLLDDDFDGAGRLSALYVRTRDRETIQKAWNRGVLEARGDVLTFLGNDEAMHPSTLTKFLQVLDDDPSVDWVQGEALVTEVSESGEFRRDLFPHSRAREPRNAQYLECCYMGFVGAAYRRSLHDRFGFYDPAFRAAGDNEWKNRILHRIKLHNIPETLGVFLNYPETRTTESPIAELEDIRAWYAFRTPEGIRYAFEGQSDDACIEQFYRALAYSRSYSSDVSTDLEYAGAVTEYLRVHRPRAHRAVAPAAAAAALVLDGYRRLDETSLERGTPRLGALESDLLGVKVAARLVMEGSELLRRRGHDIPFWYRNDNRSQQHYFAWPSVQRRFDPGEPVGVADVAGAFDLAGLAVAAGASAPLAGPDVGREEQARLSELPGFAAWAPCTAEVSEEGEWREVLAALPSDLDVLVTGPVTIAPLAGSRAHAVGSVKTERPLAAASRVAMLPGFDLPAGRSLLSRLVDCAWRGVPVVLGSGVAAALRGLSPPVDSSGFEVADEPREMAARTAALVEDGPRRAQALAANAALAEHLVRNGAVKRAVPAGASAASPWDADARMTGWVVQVCAEGAPGAREALARFMARRSEPGFRATADAVVSALMVDRSAAVLRGGGVLADLAVAPFVPDLPGAYARLHLLAARSSLPAARALAAASRLQTRAPWPQSELGAWRDGVEAAPAPAPDGPVVVLAAPAFWASADGASARVRVPEGTILATAPAATESPVGIVQGGELDRALAAARLVAVLAPEDASEDEALELWSRALASGAAVIGSARALWFTAPGASPAVYASAAEALQALPGAAEGDALSGLRAERVRLLERLGLSAWRLTSARLAA